jgi:hypothetical protein
MKNGLGNLAARDVDELAAIVKNRLKPIQYRPALIGGLLAQAGLTPEPGPPPLDCSVASACRAGARRLTYGPGGVQT